jgi:hypothetical protein
MGRHLVILFLRENNSLGMVRDILSKRQRNGMIVIDYLKEFFYIKLSIQQEDQFSFTRKRSNLNGDTKE